MWTEVYTFLRLTYEALKASSALIVRPHQAIVEHRLSGSNEQNS